MNPPTRTEIRSGLARLASLSPAVRAILPRLEDDGFSVNELVGLVAQDPILAARVLRLANSPFYGLSRQVGSLQEAAMVLGFSNLRSMVLSAGLIGSFADRQAIAQSLATAAAAKSLAAALKLDQGTAYTAGLLHNLGALLLGHFAADYWAPLASDPGDNRLSREREVFGFDHCELGAEIAADWRFPAAILQAIRQHLQPPDPQAGALTDLVHVAAALGAQAAGMGDAPPAAAAVLDRLGLIDAQGEATLVQASAAAHANLGALDKL